ncbi:hypothetical protein HYQ46_012781 [Verticillium longisporum]|nr:hypothetical protein HYQ46_012781 [Verticillium longisporum]
MQTLGGVVCRRIRSLARNVAPPVANFLLATGFFPQTLRLLFRCLGDFILLGILLGCLGIQFGRVYGVEKRTDTRESAG